MRLVFTFPGFKAGLWIGFTLWMAGCGADRDVSPAAAPNIILILADDLGYDDLGVHGNRTIETPRLDQLASRSIRFDQFYVTPVCATTRAALLTGRHFLRTGVSHVHGGKDFLHLEERTFAGALKDAGYVTGMWGKWHSGKTPGYYPWERGFDEAYMARLYQHRDNSGVLNGRELDTKGWTTEVLTDMAIRFIEKHRDRPFFAYLPYLACHAPLDCPEEYKRKYMEKGVSENLATLYGMVEQMDHQVGRVIDAVEELGLSEKTVIFFLSDNGPAVLNNLLTDGDRALRYVSGMRGHKGNIWENGIRSPLWITWKGTLEPMDTDQLADVTDLCPTILELAGISNDAGGWPLDGQSLVPLLEGDTAHPREKTVFLYANPGWPPTDMPWTPEGVRDEYRPWKCTDGGNLSFPQQIVGMRTPEYKLLMNPGPTDGTILPDPSGYVLVDMQQDPLEKRNVATQHPSEFETMRVSLERWYQSILEEPHAFAMPEFKVGAETSEKYSILAYAPHCISQGVRNASNYIHHFRRVGDSATYRLEVEEEGVYGMELYYILESDSRRNFTLILEGQHRTLDLVRDHRSVRINDLALPKGPATMILKNMTPVVRGELRLTEAVFHWERPIEQTF
jgi:arylsulfatase A-like enzyme